MGFTSASDRRRLHAALAGTRRAPRGLPLGPLAPRSHSAWDSPRGPGAHTPHCPASERPHAPSSQPRTSSLTFAGSSSQLRLCSHKLCRQQRLLQLFRAKHFTMLAIVVLTNWREELSLSQPPLYVSKRKNITNGAAVKRGWSCQARGAACHVLCLKPSDVKTGPSNFGRGLKQHCVLKNCLQR